MATASLLDTSPKTFETIYAEAGGDPARIPWEQGSASQALVNWLNAVAPTVVRCGSRVAVVGCGLGHDARSLINRGYEVTAFDCSATAIDWARRMDPANADSYVQADLFQPPPRWRHRFDLVVEVNTLQSLHPDRRLGTMSAIADLASPHGHVLVICQGGSTPARVEDGPPWPLTEAELLEAAALAGLAPDGPISCFTDGDPPSSRMRAMFARV
jgi:SAM-dependent methyltransferase